MVCLCRETNTSKENATEALEFYTQGMDAKPDNVQLKEALLLNRAA